MADPGTSDAEVRRSEGVRVVFYRRHLQAVLRFAARRCHSPEEAAELVSVVFLEVFSLLGAPVPPDVRAALYRGLASLPGVQRVEPERVAGHAGIALSAASACPARRWSG
jgi:hypothetical protein